MLRHSRQLQIFSASKPPRPALRMEPPFMWISRTYSGVSSIGSNLPGLTLQGGHGTEWQGVVRGS